MTCGIGARLQHPFYRVLLIPDNVTRFGGYYTGTPRVDSYLTIQVQSLKVRGYAKI